VILVVEATAEGVGHAQVRLASTPLNPDRTAIVAIGSRPYNLAEISAQLGLAQLGTLPADRRAAEELREGRGGRRNALVRAAGPVADAVATHLSSRVAA